MRVKLIAFKFYHIEHRQNSEGESMSHVVKVSRKGQIVIPADIRKRYRIKDRVVVKADSEGIKIIPLIPLEELFGVDGDAMKSIAKEIVEERAEERRREG